MYLTFHFISGSAVGFVLLSSFLSMFVELGVQTSLTMQDTRWVGNWWLGFAIFGAICLFWSIWLLGFPKEFPLTKKQRKIELGEILSEDEPADKEVSNFFKLFSVEKVFSSLKDRKMRDKWSELNLTVFLGNQASVRQWFHSAVLWRLSMNIPTPPLLLVPVPAARPHFDSKLSNTNHLSTSMRIIFNFLVMKGLFG